MNYFQLTEIPLAIISNLMLSSYCDKVGHRLPLLLPSIGSMLASLVTAALATPSLQWLPMSSAFIYSIVYSMFGAYSMVSITLNLHIHVSGIQN